MNQNIEQNHHCGEEHTYSGFAHLFRNTFPGLFYNFSRIFFPGIILPLERSKGTSYLLTRDGKIHAIKSLLDRPITIGADFSKSVNLYKITVLKTNAQLSYEQRYYYSIFRFLGLSRTMYHFPGLSSAGKCHSKIPGLSRTRENPQYYTLLMH